VTVVSSVVGLVFLFLPQLKPEPPPPERSAQLTERSFSRDLSFQQYLLRIDQPTASFSRERLEQRGAFVQFHFVVTGYEGKPLPLKWELFDAAAAIRWSSHGRSQSRPRATGTRATGTPGCRCPSGEGGSSSSSRSSTPRVSCRSPSCKPRLSWSG
jgi:hypothetical protein